MATPQTRLLLGLLPVGLLALVLSTHPWWVTDWAQHVIDGTPEGADGVRLSDINGDGLFDAVSGDEATGMVSVYLHPGYALARQPWPSVVVGSHPAVEDAVFVDVDGDGGSDVITAGEDGKIRIHYGPQEASRILMPDQWSTMEITAATNYQTGGRNQAWMWIRPADIDGTGGIDFFAGGKGTQLTWFAGPENPRNSGAWTVNLINDRGGWVQDIHDVDVNQDGFVDAVWSVRMIGPNPGLRWSQNPGPGPAQTRPWPTYLINKGNGKTEFQHFAIGDTDDDGLVEIFCGSDESQPEVLPVYEAADIDARDWVLHNGRMANVPRSCALGDVDGDGDQDLVTLGNGGSDWYSFPHFSGPDEQWNRTPIRSRADKVDDTVLYDVDGDGDLDVLTTDENGPQVVWFENPIRTR